MHGRDKIMPIMDIGPANIFLDTALEIARHEERYETERHKERYARFMLPFLIEL
jgi:dihydroxyacetone kinase DhaKLM complex PTS-EIIA-like component DhaM